MPLRATIFIAKYKLFWMSLEFHPRNYKDKHISSNMKMDDGTIFQYFIQRCIGNTIYTLVTFSRVVTLGETYTTAKYKISWLSLELHPSNCIGNHISLYMDINDTTIVFKYTILGCIGNTIHSLVVCSRFEPLYATNTTTKYSMFRMSLEFYPRNYKGSIYHHIWI